MALVPEQYIIIGQAKIKKAREAFDEMINHYGGENVVTGITAAKKTKLISDALAEVARYGSQGSLWEAYSALERIKITSEMAPFLTETKRQEMKNKIIEILSSL